MLRCNKGVPNQPSLCSVSPSHPTHTHFFIRTISGTQPSTPLEAAPCHECSQKPANTNLRIPRLPKRPLTPYHHITISAFLASPPHHVRHPRPPRLAAPTPDQARRNSNRLSRRRPGSPLRSRAGRPSTTRFRRAQSALSTFRLLAAAGRISQIPNWQPTAGYKRLAERADRALYGRNNWALTGRRE